MRRRDLPSGAVFRYVGVGITGWPKTADGDKDIGHLSGASFPIRDSWRDKSDDQVELLTEEKAEEALTDLKRACGL